MSAKVTRSEPSVGLDENNQYQTCDLYVSRLRGKTPEGVLIAELEPTGQRPTFAGEPREQGLAERIQLTENVFD